MSAFSSRTKVFFLLSSVLLGQVSCKSVKTRSDPSEDIPDFELLDDQVSPVGAQGSLKGTWKGQRWKLVSGSAAILGADTTPIINALLASGQQVGCMNYSKLIGPATVAGNSEKILEITVPKKVGTFNASTADLNSAAVQMYGAEETDLKAWEIVIQAVTAEKISGTVKAEFLDAEKSTFDGSFEIFLCTEQLARSDR